MQTIKLFSGAELPAIGLGTWKMEPDQAADAVASAIEVGYRHIDGAWIYQNEEGVGRGLQRAFENGVGREELWITSKLWNDRHRPEDVRSGLAETLEALQLEALDLYLIHWPIAQPRGVIRPDVAADYLPLAEVPLTETWQALEECVDAGLCRHIGVSNFNTQRLAEIMEVARIRPAVNQVESHPLLTQETLKKYCDEHQVAMTAYSPLGSGDRPEGMRKADEPSLFELPEIIAIAEEQDASPAQVLLAWGMQRGTCVIPKSASRDHQAQNLAAAELKLSEEQLARISHLDRGYRFVDGTFWETEGGPYTADWLWNG